MSTYDYKALQNGSDIRGVALPGVPGEDVNLDAEAVTRLAGGFLYWLSSRTGKKPSELTVAVGRDSRSSGEDISGLFEGSLAARGVRTLDCGLASTPAMFMATVFPEIQADGAVMVTASHLPWNRNGLKFFSADGGLDKGDITDIIVFAESSQILNMMPAGTPSAPEETDLMSLYTAHLRNLIVKAVEGVDAPAPSGSTTGNAAGPQPLAGLMIAVDAGNGAGGFYATQVLAPLGADVSASQFLDPDGTFPNHMPNPENKEAMAAIRQATLDGGCDLGLIFDTDVDRSSAVDEQGREISRNGIVAMAAALIAGDCPGTTVVTDSITSNELTEYLEGSLGLKHLRFKRGYRNVINKSMELNQAGTDSALAIETSGHAAYRENYFLDDGAYLATKIVIRTALLHREGKPISSLIADLKEPVESIEIRMPITAADFGACADKALAAISDLPAADTALTYEVVTPNYEGVRIAFRGPVNGWFLLRKSLHDPIMPLNIETDREGGAALVCANLKAQLAGIEGLDTEKL